jgi:hypothetical protein
MVVVGPAGEVLEDLPLPGVVLAAPQLALLVHRLPLLLDAGLRQHRLHEEIAQPLHALQELPVGDFEVVIRLLVRRPRVVHP